MSNLIFPVNYVYYGVLCTDSANDVSFHLWSFSASRKVWDNMARKSSIPPTRQILCAWPRYWKPSLGYFIYNWNCAYSSHISTHNRPMWLTDVWEHYHLGLQNVTFSFLPSCLTRQRQLWGIWCGQLYWEWARGGSKRVRGAPTVNIISQVYTSRGYNK